MARARDAIRAARSDKLTGDIVVQLSGGIYLDVGSGFIEISGNVVYNVQNPLNYNNRAQDRIATCTERDNVVGPPGEMNLVPATLGTKAQAIIGKAGPLH